MEVQTINFQTQYSYHPSSTNTRDNRLRENLHNRNEVSFGNSADKFEKRPVEQKSATGLFRTGLKPNSQTKNFIQEYKNNINHTLEHKLVYALIYKELFGHMTLDCITHDLDKLVLYLFGFKHSFVSKFHRKISEHHIESGKIQNIPSVITDNIASSEIFKPGNKLTCREVVAKFFEGKATQEMLLGFKTKNYGEDLDLELINHKKDIILKGLKKKTGVFFLTKKLAQNLI